MDANIHDDEIEITPEMVDAAAERLMSLCEIGPQAAKSIALEVLLAALDMRTSHPARIS